MIQNWYAILNESEVPSPAVLLFPGRIEENIRRMIRLAGGSERLRPHVKTHKIPQVLALQLAQGISRFKAATIAECEMVAAAGGTDVLLAYPLVGPNIERFVQLVRRFPKTHFSALADHVGTVGLIDKIAGHSGVQFDMLVDLNVGQNRTGIVPGDGAADVYRAIHKSANLRAAGLHAYDGHLHDADHAKLVADAEKAFEPVWQLRDRLRAEGILVPKVVASGTPTFPVLAQHSEVEVGCGTTILWDFGQSINSPDLDFLNAAVLLIRVISKPCAGRLCLDLGHKAVASEMPHPRVKLLGLEDAQVVIHSEEHLVVETARADAYEIGDVIYGIPRHVCPTVALHHEVWTVRDGRATERWEVVARKRRITI